MSFLTNLIKHAVARLSTDANGNTVLVGVGANYAVSITPSENTSAGITAAIASIVALSGSGVVRLLAADYTFTEAVEVPSGISIIGVRPAFLYDADSASPDVPDIPTSFVSGTRCIGGAGIRGFVGNNTDQVSPLASFASNAISGVEIANIYFEDFDQAIDFGATNNCGLTMSSIHDIWTRGCGNGTFGINLENFLNCDFKRFFDWNTNTTHGGIRFASSVSASLLIPGNAVVKHIYTRSIKRNNRGIVFETEAGCNLNELTCPRLQANRFGEDEHSSACAITVSDVNLGVDDATKFPVGIPVIFTTTANTIQANTIYYVRDSNATNNTIQIANSQSSTVVTPSGGTAMTVKTAGYPCIEIIGNSTGAVVHSSFTGLDLESIKQVSLGVTYANECFFQVMQCVPGSHRNIVSRLSNECRFESLNEATTTDIDTTGKNNHYFGSRTTAIQQLGTGLINGHFVGSAGTTIADTAANGTTGTATLTTGSNDRSGQITVTPGGTGITTGVVATVTYAKAASYSFPSLTPANANAAAAMAAGYVRAQETIRGTGFDVVADTALTDATAYVFNYHS